MKFATPLILALAAPLVAGSVLRERQASSSSSSATSSSSTSSSSSASSGGAFPTDIGYLGKGSPGQVPFLAENDTLPGSRGNSPYEYRFNATDADAEEFDIWKSMGNLSPYYSSPSYPETTAHKVLNDTCSVKQVHIFHRHGARYPTSGSSEGAPLLGQTVANYTAAGNLTANGPLAFLKKWTYGLGTELLVPIGAQQLFDSGVYHYQQYGKLFNTSLPHKPVVRTPSQSRMLNSSRYFTLGFFGYDAPEKIDLEVIIETDGFNSSLSPYDDCPSAENVYVGDDYLAPVWRKIYTKSAIERLQPHTNIPLTPDLIYGALSVCPYQSAALGYSPWCGVFTREEWEGFELDLDLQFAGDYGFLSPTGRAQGIGYVQELLDRLSNSSFSGPVTTQNSTLDESSTYFPLDQPIYIDFTHDDVIVSVLTALNMTQTGDYLSSTHRDPKRNFVLSRIAPFAGRLVFEVIECSGKHYIRILNNEAIIPLNEDQGCPRRADGMCPLEDFIKHQKAHAYKDSNFDYVCFGNYTTPHSGVRNGTLG